jgi:hypothetical protein
MLAAAGFLVKSGKVWEFLEVGRPFVRLFDRKASGGGQMEIGE